MSQPHDHDRTQDDGPDATHPGRQTRDNEPTEVLVVYEAGAHGTARPGTPQFAPQHSAPQQPSTPWMPAVPRRRAGRTLVAIGAAFALAIGLTATGVAVGHQLSSADFLTQSSETSSETSSDTYSADSADSADDAGMHPGDGGPGALRGGPGRGAGGDAPAQPGAADASTSGATAVDAAADAAVVETTAATADQSVGIVLLEAALGYDGAVAAGTGVILSSDGLILTNNHVIDSATAIRVTIASTGVSYFAQVVGTDESQDIAVLQLTDAEGLTPADLDTSGDAALGDAVTGVGNAGGTGVLTAVAGYVSGLNETITAQNADGSAAERLSGLIEVNADIRSGDSGGPLLDSDGEVIGINTAASSGGGDITGYAITIETALAAVADIESD